jgi:hypothetical protein
VGGSDPHGGHGYICEGDAVLFWGEEGESLDRRNETILLQVAETFPCVEWISRICLRSGHLLC